METAFEPRTLVNGGMLRQNQGQNVSILVCVEDEAGTNLNATTTDNKSIHVQLPEPLGARKGQWVEIIGKPSGEVIRAKEAILFGGEDINFDKDGYNMMVQFMSNGKEIFRSG